MGSQYSLGDTPAELEHLLVFSKVEQAYRRCVNDIMVHFLRLPALSRVACLLRILLLFRFLRLARAENHADPDVHFITFAAFKRIFCKSLAPPLALRIFRTYFQRSSSHDDGPRRATSAEVFGALALAAPAEANAKVRFIFRLHDHDCDQRLNRVELALAVGTASRGLARLKRNPFPPPDHVVARVVQGSFGHPDASLHPDTGDIGWLGIAAFLGSDKPCLAYFRGLEAASFDASGLYKRQEKLLLKLAHVDKRFVLSNSQCFIR